MYYQNSGCSILSRVLGKGGKLATDNWTMIPRLLKQFVAVLLGNLLYFFVLMPHLPPAARHTPYQLDWGLVVDLWVCLVVYGLIELAVRFWRSRYSGTHR